METGLSIRNNQNEITQIIQDSNNMYLSVLQAVGLPTENVLSSLDERKIVIANLQLVIDKMNTELIRESYYLSKFFVAVSTGLFDAALNYLWDETIKQLRIRVINGDIKYFYDVVISDERRKQFNLPEDLLKLNDFDLIKGSLEIGLITQIGYKHLDFIRYMRNWASAAHPNQTELTGLNLISWLETCIKEVIATPPSSIQVKIGKLLANIKSEVIDDDQASMIIPFFTELNIEKADALAKGFFGMYINEKTSQQTRSNINNLAPELWQIISEEVKSNFGIRYATFLANGDNQAKNEAKRFLEVVGGMSYLPDTVKTPIIKKSLENLMMAHNSFNNFYNEPSFARQLRAVVGDHGTIPPQMNFLYVKVIVSVFLTNGSGEAWGANPIYTELIKNFDAQQSLIALTSFMDESIRSKLQFSLCQKKFTEMIGYIESNVTSEGVLDLLVEIRSKVKFLQDISNEDKLIDKIRFFQKNYLK
ncbi:hypothetical protein [Dolosigranulum pigrum]|jgi:hypothetical protein|uniref:hypothetical protein n=1 Tax=Dolosigranulum pigrum TaxID=29394 RepID=UPI00155EBD3A|nr:hypothetical protein [Dolosigranulum pigrum]QJS95847.1 hypothetical protein B5772_02435 [Dolosigranulum pigrum]QTJ45005.1 hypothetical protein FE328_05310 [Dolosigranulum pigrum]